MGVELIDGNMICDFTPFTRFLITPQRQESDIERLCAVEHRLRIEMICTSWNRSIELPGPIVGLMMDERRSKGMDIGGSHIKSSPQIVSENCFPSVLP